MNNKIINTEHEKSATIEDLGQHTHKWETVNLIIVSVLGNDSSKPINEKN